MAVKEQMELRLSGEPLTGETIQTMAESFKALADPTRLRILALISEQEWQCWGYRRPFGGLAERGLAPTEVVAQSGYCALSQRRPGGLLLTWRTTMSVIS